jgi:predicted transcriptional regulator
MTNLLHQKLSERFEVAFNQIHAWLQRNSKHTYSDKFSDLIREGFPKHAIIRKHFHDLKMFARLRNSIVHDKVQLGFYIAEPHERVVEQIENIASQMVEPKLALSIASKPVFYYFEDAKLKDILTVVKKKSYSVFPIYDENGFKWFLTADCIIQWLADRNDESPIQLNDVRVRELYPLKKQLPVEFVNKEVDIFEVEEIFERYHMKNQKLEAVIITESGLQREKPLGIVTSWDLVEIDTLD